MSVGSSSTPPVSFEGQGPGVCVRETDYKTMRGAWEVSG